MGGVIISPNIKKTSTRINVNGDIVDPKTKQVIAPAEQPDYVPTGKDFEELAKKPVGPIPMKGSKVQPPNAAQRKPDAPAQEQEGGGTIAELVKAELKNSIVEAVKGIDLKAMVADAIKDALK